MTGRKVRSLVVVGWTLYAIPFASALAYAQITGSATPGQPVRALPEVIRPAPAFIGAVRSGTRTMTGLPGAAYWQNWAAYRIRVRVDPEAKRVAGSTTIRYQNRSPDELNGVVLDVLQNFHSPDAIRLEPAEATGGMELTRLSVNGTLADAGGSRLPRYDSDGTKLLVVFERPVLSGDTVEIAIDFSFTIPESGISGRMGYNADNLIYLAYFYPQMGVYDDVVGWQMDQFLGSAEFYSGFGNYEVTVEAPSGWLVMGTGELTNAAEVLSPAVLGRMLAAERSDTVVQVLRAADATNATRQTGDGLLSWNFRADSVRDVAYSLTRSSNWDAARAEVGDQNGDGQADYTRVDAIYRPQARRWGNVVRFAQHSIEFLSRYTGYAYPWSHMTAVEGAGIIGGGMEYPMMTLIGDYNAAGDSALYAVTVHEVAHMWIPMIASVDERRYSWLDEGTTSFNENQGRRAFYPGTDPTPGDRETYLDVARAGEEGEIMRRSDYHYPGPAYVIASYYKPSLVLEALRGVLGEETFNRAFREFFHRWAFKHPYPWDFWNTFENVSGRDLDWFWHSWYHETWLLDQTISRVTPTSQGTEITIDDRGNIPMPVLLEITLANGQTSRAEIPVERWLAGTRTTSITVPGDVIRVRIDPENRFPDVNPADNVWVR